MAVTTNLKFDKINWDKPIETIDRCVPCEILGTLATKKVVKWEWEGNCFVRLVDDNGFSYHTNGSLSCEVPVYRNKKVKKEGWIGLWFRANNDSPEIAFTSPAYKSEETAKIYCAGAATVIKIEWEE